MLKQFVVRTAPLTNAAMIVDATSRDNGRLRAVIGGKECEIGMDTYAASGSVDLPTAQKIVQAYAKQNNIPDTDVMVRVRLPKTNVKPRQARKLDDANLVLVKSEKKSETGTQESSQDYQSLQERAAHDLATKVQALQDQHTREKKKPKEKVEPKVEQKASAEKPEGAVVQTKQRRAYNKKDSEKSKRSAAALKRYHEELAKTGAESPTIMEAAKPGPGVSQEQIDDATMNLALALARILRNNPGVL